MTRYRCTNTECAKYEEFLSPESVITVPQFGGSLYHRFERQGALLDPIFGVANARRIGGEPEPFPLPCGPVERIDGPCRIRLRRTKGWRKPEGAIYVGRPGPYGNPFRIGDVWLMWAAVAIGYKATQAGQRDAAVALHRAWLTKGQLRIREYAPIENGIYDGGALEFGDGSTVTLAEGAAGFAAWCLATCKQPELPERPDLEPLRGRDLLCWCKPDEACHADVLLEIANGAGVTPADHYGLDGR